MRRKASQKASVLERFAVNQSLWQAMQAFEEQSLLELGLARRAADSSVDEERIVVQLQFGSGREMER